MRRAEQLWVTSHQSCHKPIFPSHGICSTLPPGSQVSYCWEVACYVEQCCPVCALFVWIHLLSVFILELERSLSGVAQSLFCLSPCITGGWLETGSLHCLVSNSWAFLAGDIWLCIWNSLLSKAPAKLIRREAGKSLLQSWVFLLVNQCRSTGFLATLFEVWPDFSPCNLAWEKLTMGEGTGKKEGCILKELAGPTGCWLKSSANWTSCVDFCSALGTVLMCGLAPASLKPLWKSLFGSALDCSGVLGLFVQLLQWPSSYLSHCQIEWAHLNGHLLFSAAPKLACKGVFPCSVLCSECLIRLQEKGAEVARCF